jgi:hypothetical protein
MVAALAAWIRELVITRKSERVGLAYLNSTDDRANENYALLKKHLKLKNGTGVLREVEYCTHPAGRYPKKCKFKSEVLVLIGGQKFTTLK